MADEEKVCIQYVCKVCMCVCKRETDRMNEGEFARACARARARAWRKRPHFMMN